MTGDAGSSTAVRYPGVTFHPWVGRDYLESPFGVRVLVLGESHYGEGDVRPDLTSKVVRRLGQATRYPFFTVIAKILRGTTGSITNEDRAGVWEDVAFYNFVQDFVGNQPRNRPTIRQWSDAQEPFETVLAALRPHAVLILGYDLADHMLCLNIERQSIRYGRQEAEAVAGIIQHPAGPMRYSESIPAFENLLRRARELGGP